MIFDLFSQYGWLIMFLCIGYVTGTISEKRHYRSIRKREKALLNTPMVTFDDKLDTDIQYERGVLVVGSVVVSTDYFKRFVAYLRNIFGGRISAYESLIDRARREAMLRMREQVQGADMFINVRVETSSISKNANSKKVVGTVEALAYGTAVYFR